MGLVVAMFRRTPRRAMFKVFVAFLVVCLMLLLCYSASLSVNTFISSLEQGRFPSLGLDGALRNDDSQDILLVFKSTKLSRDEMAARMEKRTPNLPVRFWLEVKDKDLSKNTSCAQFPSLYDLNYVDTHWQELQTVDGPYHLFGAYFDNRTLVKEAPAVRIIGQIAKINVKTSLFCQLWFEEHKEPAFAPVFEHRYLWRAAMGVYENGVMQPYMFSCQVPHEYRGTVPQAVSVVEKPCDNAKTNLKVNNILPPSGKKEGFAVCVKGMSFPFVDFSVRLVEWLELLFILGADKVFFYDYDMHPNISKVLSYYEEQGRVEVIKLPLSGRRPNAFGLLNMFLGFIGKIPKEHEETVPYNDCFMKNINRYKFVSAMDTDEVIIPKVSSSWETMMNIVVAKALDTSKKPPSSYVMRHVYFLDDMGYSNETVRDVPPYMHMLRHVRRSRNYNHPEHYIKSFFDTERVLSIHNHFPLTCLGAGCSPYFVNTSDGHLQHYRHYCVEHLESVCEKAFRNDSVRDTNIFRFKEPLISGVKRTLLKLGFVNQLP
ncbi:uncharacterized protein LOC135199996 [Macrobrachium nipponense]|uniref:uncharacterized protein LOC135199996 n=1 Tax=Macrobrachium nipponense TaxID=159736 RepID=UPI0030C7AF2F